MLELKFEIGQNALKFRIVFRLLIHEFRFFLFYAMGHPNQDFQ